MEMEIWRYVNMEILYQQADNFQFSIFQFFNLSTGRLGGVYVMKKETWKTIIQLVISVLTAVATTLGVTSCM